MAIKIRPFHGIEHPGGGKSNGAYKVAGHGSVDDTVKTSDGHKDYLHRKKFVEKICNDP